MDHLNRARESHCGFGGAANRLARRQRQHWAQALAASEQAIAHRLNQPIGSGPVFRQHRAERPLNQFRTLMQIGLDFERRFCVAAPICIIQRIRFHFGYVTVAAQSTKRVGAARMSEVQRAPAQDM